jgi:hypothetical protein
VRQKIGKEKELNCLLFHKVVRPSFVVTKRGCIERKIRAVLKEAQKKAVTASNHPHIENFM